jgi:hypothetical protein
MNNYGQQIGYFFLVPKWTPRTMPTIARMVTTMIKQIHRFFRAARADATALSVCRKLDIRINSSENTSQQIVIQTRTQFQCPFRR